VDLGIEGRRAAVAASSAGLGFSTAAARHAEGVAVALCSRSKERVEAAAARLDGALALVADVSSPEGATAFVRDARDALGGLDILITNAGGPPRGNVSSIDVDQYDAALRLNLLSVIAMCKEGVPGMQEQKWGRVVAITSAAVRQPNPNLVLSNVARSGATAFLKTLATEVAGHGVTVNSLQPGLHATDRLKELGGNLEAMARTVPAGFVGDPSDFGAVAAFLCSEQARFITGVHIQVDGGAYPGLI